MIEVEDLWKSYGSLAVLKGANLTIPEGQTLVILGRSGVGKSVLLRQLIGIERPDRGRVFVEGVCVSEAKPRDLLFALRNMGMLFQGAALFDSLNIFDNAAFHLHQHGNLKTGKPFSPAEVEERVKWALGMVGLEGTEEKMPSDLSGGMKKRAGLARLIVYKPNVLLYDEPTTGLDPITAMQINQLILKTQAELNATSVVVTHDLVTARTVGNFIALSHEGKMAWVGPTEDFFESDHPLIKSFLENSLAAIQYRKRD